MGRKPAPKPLTLSDTTAVSDDRPGQQRPAETFSANSPVESRSPRSPRSPFRFTHKKSPELGISQPPQPANVLHQQQRIPHIQDEHQFPLISSALGHAFENQLVLNLNESPQQQQQQPHDHGVGLLHIDQIDGPPQRPQDRTQTQSQTPTQSPHLCQHQHNQTPNQRQRHREEKASKSGFLFNFKSLSTKSTDRLHSHHHTDSRGDAMSRGADQPALTKESSKQSESSYTDSHIQRPVASLPSKSDVSLASSADYEQTGITGSAKRGKPKPFTLLGRSRSIRDKDTQSPKYKDSTPVKTPVLEPPERAYTTAPLRTAPGPPDRSFREMMSSAVRNHSADRSHPLDMPGRDKENQRERDQLRVQPSSYRENGMGSTFFSGLKSSGSRAADMISKGLFGKGSRGGSTIEKEPVVDDEHYQLKVINLPLVEQVRLTRISKRLEDSRDKTEFWMPAFPWRAIDYLNYKGTEVEGLYRVPGSGPQIKKWQRRFDEEYDVDLFAQDDLYDINIIGSMLKAWLRQLPDELFPKAAQERIARQCAGAETVPQMLIDELSSLSPFNYYLLFAITCHLSLLLAHSDKNKMDFRNLCICFQPCMKIDVFCFKFLVCDWRDCWKGCRDEARYIEEEYMLFDQPPPRGITADPQQQQQEQQHQQQRKNKEQDSWESHEDRNVSSSDSSKQWNQRDATKPRPKVTVPPENGSVASTSTISTTLTIDSQREGPPRRSGEMRPLSPIKPLSPLGF